MAFISSLILFAGSMFGVWWTNRAGDRRAVQERENQRDRDFRLWQRDTMLRLGDEIMQAATEVPDEYKRIHKTPVADDSSFGVVDGWRRKLDVSVVRLDLIGASEAEQRCAELRDAIKDPQLRKAIIALSPENWLAVDVDTNTAEKEFKEQLSAQYESGIKGIQTAALAVGEAIQRDLARTNQPNPSHHPDSESRSAGE